MQQDKMTNSSTVESLLSAKEKLQLPLIRDKLTHSVDHPALILIGVDSPGLGKAFLQFVRDESPLPVIDYQVKRKEDLAPYKTAKLLKKDVFHVFCLFDSPGLSLEDTAAVLIFYRDYIPQFGLKIVVIASHKLLNTIIEKAYDFYSISGFTGYFSDFAQAIQEDLDMSQFKSEVAEEYEKRKWELDEFRKGNPGPSLIYMKKLVNAANSADEMQKTGEALELFQEALNIAIQLRDRGNQAAITGNIGLAHYRSGQIEKALELYDKALNIAGEIGDREREATILAYIGNVHFRKGNADVALQFHSKALEVHRETGNLVQVVSGLNQTGLIYATLKSDCKKARDFYKEALHIAKKEGFAEFHAISLQNLANSAFFKGDTGEALKYAKNALKVSKAAGNLNNVVPSLHNIAYYYTETGDYNTALKYYFDILEIIGTQHDLSMRMSVLRNIGHIYNGINELETAENFLNQALSIARRLGNINEESSILGDIAVNYARKGEYGKAVELNTEALQQARISGVVSEEVKFLGNIANDYLNMGKLDDSLNFYNLCLAKAGEAGISRAIAYSKQGIGVIMAEKGKIADGIRFLKEGIKMSRNVGHLEGEVNGLMGLGDVYRKTGKNAEAKKYFNKALNIAKNAGFKDLSFTASEIIKQLETETDD